MSSLGNDISCFSIVIIIIIVIVIRPILKSAPQYLSLLVPVADLLGRRHYAPLAPIACCCPLPDFR